MSVHDYQLMHMTEIGFENPGMTSLSPVFALLGRAGKKKLFENSQKIEVFFLAQDFF